MERTFAIIKPDVFKAGNAGKILTRIYAEGFKILGLKKLCLSKKEAEGRRKPEQGGKNPERLKA